ncbi:MULTISPECIES: recombinase family protein [Acinetobacter]|jgi:putative DNA-invertase from lambdoid prophage Rac|uniref:DNA-invertase from lambdoid prophage Rac n=1 Tax=Acinetobacter calcoaceticus TaxID=471 RepID=A0ABD5AR93_ACICA|nr:MULTISPECIES: recombinase family protein [Acinetobacter]MBJ9705284.1 recombinase family protein [Acinetobacter calcoaceticus]MDP9804833.1 putative DNA-invertase from lambdoid prophage Rac [Acinetobacter calcoaceticus]SEO71799.1 putative DNA-invertase from lambdoid prophage Rac [Acinetobacter sp. yr461]
MRTYAYVRIEPNLQFEFSRYISFFSEYGYKIQKNRLVVEEVSVDKSIAYRDKFLNLISYSLEEGDILVIKSMDCLGNSFEEILGIVDKIDQKKIRLICLDYSKNEINGDLKIFFLHFLKLSAEFEKLFKADNKKFKDHKPTRKVGRPEILNNEQKNRVIELFKKGYSVYSLAKEFAVTRTVIQRILNNASKSNAL